MYKGEKLGSTGLPAIFGPSEEGWDHPAFNRIRPGSIASPDKSLLTAPEVDPDDPVEGLSRVARARKIDKMVRYVQNPHRERQLQLARDHLRVVRSLSEQANEQSQAQPPASVPRGASAPQRPSRVSRRVQGLPPEFEGLNQVEIDQIYEQNEEQMYNLAYSSIDWSKDRVSPINRTIS